MLREASKVLLVEKQKAISIAESEYNKNSNELEKEFVCLIDELNEEFTGLKNHFSSLQKEVSDAQTKKTNLDNDHKEKSQKFCSTNSGLKNERDQLQKQKSFYSMKSSHLRKMKNL